MKPKNVTPGTYIEYTSDVNRMRVEIKLLLM